jgi:predicted AlkP superfamily pyrophosphatase or phosphodiesterase
LERRRRLSTSFGLFHEILNQPKEMSMKKFLAAALSLGLMGSTLPSPVQANDDDSGKHRKFKHVLLISIDGMHAVDYLNCAKGLSTVNGGAPYCPNLAELGETGVN